MKHKIVALKAAYLGRTPHGVRGLKHGEIVFTTEEGESHPAWVRLYLPGVAALLAMTGITKVVPGAVKTGEKTGVTMQAKENTIFDGVIIYSAFLPSGKAGVSRDRRRRSLPLRAV